MLRIFTIITILIVGHTCYAQSSDKSSISFEGLKDGVIKRELAFFNIASSFVADNASLPKSKVSEIPLINCNDSSSIFIEGDLIISIHSERFDTIGHKMGYRQDGTHRDLITIDDLKFMGTDGEIPNEQIKSVSFKSKNHSFNLPRKAISGLYQPNFCAISDEKFLIHLSRVFISQDKKRIYIYMSNGDGAGGYEVTWIIQDNKYVRRVVDYGF